MEKELIRHYTLLVDFLGHILGPDYEIALHELTNDSNRIIAIANGELTGRHIGSPLSNKMLAYVAGHLYETQDYVLDFESVSATGKKMRTNSMFIKGLSVELAGQAGSAESDGELVARLARIAEGLSWDGRPVFGRVLEQARISVSEDACTLMREVQHGGGQASYMLYGSDLAAGHHAPDFDFDEAVLAKGALMLASAVLDLAGSRDSRL